MAKWLVTIDDEGVQAQFGLGSGDMDKNAEDEKAFSKIDLKNKAKVIFVFTRKKLPSDDYSDRRELDSIAKGMKSSFYQKRGAFDPSEHFGYDMRKKSLGKYIEVVSELEADDVSEFHRKYSGLDGAIDILFNAERIMSPTTDPGKTIMKWVKRLELEQEDD